MAHDGWFVKNQHWRHGSSLRQLLTIHGAGYKLVA
jgi:hypothetical protein